MSASALRGNYQHTFHVFVAVAAILGAENREFSSGRRDEFDRHRLAAARHLLVDLEFLDLDAVHAVSRRDDEASRARLGDLDARRLEGESLCATISSESAARASLPEQDGAEAAAGSC